MTGQFVILCCENIRPEVEAVLATGAMPKATVRSYPFHCGHVRSVWETVKDQFGELESAGDAVCLCGCGCANTFDIPQEFLIRPSLVLAESGPQLFLPEAIFSEFRRCGAYVILPGWLLRWKQNAEKDGLSQATAQEMFRESLSAIVLLDTGLRPDIDPVLGEFAEFCGLPARTFPVGIEHFRFRLAALYHAWESRDEAKACRELVNAAEKRAADYSMVADLTGRLVGIHDEQAAIMLVLDFIVLLFSPEKTGFLPESAAGRGGVISIPAGAYPDPGHFQQTIDKARWYQITGNGDSFLCQVTFNDELIGTLSIDRVSLPGSLDEYINLTRFIARVAGLSITIARTHDDLMLAVKAREMEIAERIRAELALRESEEQQKQQKQDMAFKVRELNCLYEIGRLVETSDTTDALLQSIADILPSAGQYPDLTCARLVIEGREFLSGAFTASNRVGEARIIIHGKEIGKIEIFFRGAEDVSRLPVPVAETDLLSAIAERLGRILERKEVEEALRESEEKYRTLVESSFDGIAIHQDGILVYVNKTAARLLGSGDPGDFIGKPAIDIVAPAYRDQVAGRIRQSPGKTLDLMREQFLRLDGIPIDIDVTTAPSIWKGKPAAYVTFRDITAQASAERALRESEERYRTIIENIQDVYFRVGRDSRIEMVSPSGAPAFGYASSTEMLGKPIGSLWSHPEQWPPFLEAMREQGGAVQDWEAEFVKTDGTTFWVSISAHLRMDRQDGFLGTEGIIRNISERKKMEAALKGTLTKLNMLSSITRHDILNQITGLRTFLELSKEDLKGTKYENFILKEDQAAEAIQRQIEFTKFYQDIGVNAPKWQDAAAVIREAAQQISLPAIDLQINVDGVEIFADSLIMKVFFNLIENSLRHGERVTRMSFSTRKSVEGLIIVFRDNGAGISAEDKKKLFQRGFGKHTGLGLFLSREILAITGITITENGEPGKGVQFEITVPYGAFRLHP